MTPRRVEMPSSSRCCMTVTLIELVGERHAVALPVGARPRGSRRWRHRQARAPRCALVCGRQRPASARISGSRFSCSRPIAACMSVIR